MLTPRPSSPSERTGKDSGPSGGTRGSDHGDELSAVLAALAAHDPDVLLAVAEVDRSLIRLTLELAPLERVRSSAASAATLGRFRRFVE